MGGGVASFLRGTIGTSTKGILTGLWPQGFAGGFPGAVSLSFVTERLSAFCLSFTDSFIEGAEEELILEPAVEDTCSGLDYF